MHDSHIHLTREPLISNIKEIVERFLQNNGKYILSQATEVEDFDNNIKLTKIFPNVVQASVGIHPTIFEEITVGKSINSGKEENEDCDIFLVGQNQINAFEKYFRKHTKDICAVGECGLDYYQFSTNVSYSEDTIEQLKEIQKLSFRKHLQLAKEFKLPLSIHARDVFGSTECVEDTIRLVAEEGNGILQGSFHSYTGDIKFVQQILDLGFHIGFNGIITYKSGESVREILKQTPLERILFETDGPFLPPQSVRKNNHIKEKFAQPYDVKEIMETASEIKGIPYEELEKTTDENYSLLFL
ncbi:MAG: TatD family hydrolase [Candidatus Dojkabacteria bacterium]|jgi:TatD DNase family protein